MWRQKTKWILLSLKIARCLARNCASWLNNHKCLLRSILRRSMPSCSKLYCLFFFQSTFETGFNSLWIYFSRAIHLNLNTWMLWRLHAQFTFCYWSKCFLFNFYINKISACQIVLVYMCELGKTFIRMLFVKRSAG